jgi:hypothetical protein
MRKLVLLTLCAVMVVSVASYVISVQAKVKYDDELIVTATPDVLWPPNHKMVSITLDAFCIVCSPGNPCACCAKAYIEGIESNEPIVEGVDYIIYNTHPPTLALRAERSGKTGEGRIYQIHVREALPKLCCDPNYATVIVTVPHDQR